MEKGVCSGEMEAKDWRQEQERLERVRNKLQARIAELEPEVAGLRDQATDIRKRFWEEVTINTSTYEDFEETFYTINQQSAVLAERERGHKLLTQQWKSMKRLLPSPYFGRIDFQEDGLDLSEQIYIGVSSFVDEDGLSFLIYDWRTPIASLYYDYSPAWRLMSRRLEESKGIWSSNGNFRFKTGKSATCLTRAKRSETNCCSKCSAKVLTRK